MSPLVSFSFVRSCELDSLSQMLYIIDYKPNPQVILHTVQYTPYKILAEKSPQTVTWVNVMIMALKIEQ